MAQITKVYLLDVPLESDYKNTLYFTSKANQQSYFQSRVVKSYTDFTYQRKDHIIRIPDIYDNIYHCNYVMYQNSAYSNKWFYAFIRSMKYINDDRTDIEIETDVIQTWLFDYQLKASFVEREHVSNDTIGLHTVPESLETGEYIMESATDNAELADICPVVAMNYNPTVSDGENTGDYTGNIYQGYALYVVKTILDTGMASSQVMGIKGLMKNLAGQGKADAVISVFMAPKALAGFNDTNGWTQLDYDCKVKYAQPSYSGYSSYEAANLSDMTTTKPTTLNGYTPRNKKLLTYPYCFMNLDNNSGSTVSYRYEDFSANNITFKVKATITPGCSIRAIPVNYKNIALNNAEGLNMGKYPISSWPSDIYTNWLTQQGVNIATDVLTSAGSVIGGLGLMATGAGAVAGASMVGGGLLGITNSVGEIYAHSLQPTQTKGNINSGDVNAGLNKCTFTIEKMSIKQEYAQIIDKYFDMFGYKVNMVKVPNTAHRSRWWFTKTIDVNIDGAIPNEDMQTIKNAYNNGITFWRNASEIQNYSLSNGIV